MRTPSLYTLTRAAALGASVLLPGVAMHEAPQPPAAPPPPAPAGTVEAGPLVMGTSLPLELLADGLVPLLPYEGAFYAGDTEGAEETAFFHLDDPFGNPFTGLHGEPFGAPFGEPFGEPFGSAYGPPHAPGPHGLAASEGEAAEGETGEGGTEAFGARRPAGRSLLAAPRPALPLLSVVAPTSVLGPWLQAFAHPDPDERPLLPYVPRAEGAEAGPLRVTLPPVFLAALGEAAVRPVFGGVDYTDPTGVGLPLLRVFGYEDAPLSPGFRVRDFATRDGAPLARISPRLVQGLERLRQAAGPFYVISGYRHPAHNAAVGGSRVSQHMAGQAADLFSPTRTSVELARAAVEAFGCGVGLGLGRRTLHVDVRGHLATWTYPGAPLSETAFDLWVLLLCDRVSPADLGDLLQVEWTLPDSLSDVDLLNRLRWLVDEPSPADSVTREAAEQLLQRRRLVLAAYARSGLRSGTPGAVVADFSEGLPPDAAPLALRYVRAGTPEADHLGVTPLVEWVSAQRHQYAYFVYAVRFPGGRTDVGIMSMSAAAAPPSSLEPSAPSFPPAVAPAGPPAGPSEGTAAPATAAPARVAPAPAPTSGPAAGWGIVVNSTTDAVEAERDAERYRRALGQAGQPAPPVAIRATEEDRPRYRVVVGAFAGAEEARRALEESLAGRVPRDAWLLPPGN